MAAKHFKCYSMLETVLSKTKEHAKILDFGCFGWQAAKISKQMGRDFEHHGCDMRKPKFIPDNAQFHLVDLESRSIAAEDDSFDLVIASHVIEHVKDPLELFQELARVTKPGGRIYIETPSDRALLVPSDAHVESHSLFSFWDDPTHVRPWPPAALYRLAIFHGMRPLECKYLSSLKEKLLLPFRHLEAIITQDRHKLSESLWLANGWAAYALIEKPMSMKGVPIFRYMFLKEVPNGVNAALEFYNAL